MLNGGTVLTPRSSGHGNSKCNATAARSGARKPAIRQPWRRFVKDANVGGLVAARAAATATALRYRSTAAGGPDTET
jgi:hypothetical protein